MLAVIFAIWVPFCVGSLTRMTKNRAYWLGSGKMPACGIVVAIFFFPIRLPQLVEREAETWDERLHEVTHFRQINAFDRISQRLLCL